MKKKNGFTLIELIVTIVLILSVMVLAIIGFNNISKSKKEETFEIVKKTVESAATDYITSNKYLLEILSPNSDIVKVTLGTLVAEDYLDKVTNPIDGNPLNRCSIVSITKNNGGYDYNFDNNDIMKDCDNVNNQIVEVTDRSAPSLTITPIGEKGYNGWYKRNPKAPVLKEDDVSIDEEKNSDKEKEILGIKLQIDAIDKQSSFNSGIQILDNTTGTWKNLSSSAYIEDDTEQVITNQLTVYDTKSYATTVENKKTCYKVTNIDGISTTKCKIYSVDTDVPTCNIKIIGGKEKYKGVDAYYSLPPFQPIIPITYADVGSGVNDKKYLFNGLEFDYVSPLVAIILNSNPEKRTWNGSVSDKAGNRNTCTLEANVFRKSMIDSFLDNTEYCADSQGESTIWTNGNRTITQYYKTLSGTKKGNSGQITFNTEGMTQTLTSPNHPNCTVNTYIDKTPPTLDKVDVSKARLVQRDVNGNIIQDRQITINGSNGNYEARICLINKAGSFDIYGYTTYAKDNLSNINSSTWQTSESWYSENLKKAISPGCLRTKDENPCKKTVKKYVSDKAGNRGLIATYTFVIGYKNNKVSGHHYEDWCDNW